VLYAANACNDAAFTEFLCNDSYDVPTNTGLNGGEVVSFHVHAGNTYYIVVDAFNPGTTGSYTLMLDLATGNTCADPVPITIEPGAPQTVLGTNSNVAPATQGSCGGGAAGEVVYRVTRPDTAPLQIDTDPNSTTFDSVLYARSDCSSTSSELACSNQAGTAAESITFDLTAGTAAYVFVDGSQAGGTAASGNYGLILTP
jgi:hypothetical protein